MKSTCGLVVVSGLVACMHACVRCTVWIGRSLCAGRSDDGFDAKMIGATRTQSDRRLSDRYLGRASGRPWSMAHMHADRKYRSFFDVHACACERFFVFLLKRLRQCIPFFFCVSAYLGLLFQTKKGHEICVILLFFLENMSYSYEHLWETDRQRRLVADDHDIPLKE